MENRSRYTTKYFHDNMPEWKRKKDSFVLRYFIRPLSFAGASFCANLGIDANTVSYASCIVALIASALFIPNNHVCHIIAGVMVVVWIWMDCIDGNLARGVKKQPFGDFADGIAGYFLLSFICLGMSWAAYNEGGLFFSVGNPIIIMVGALASIMDPLMRLIYQKYTYNQMVLEEKGIMPKEEDIMKDHNQVGNWKIKMIMLTGVSGILPIFILICAIFKILDVVVLYCFIINIVQFGYSVFSYCGKAIRNAKVYQSAMDEKYKE